MIRYLRGGHVYAQLIRFALVGGVSNAAYILLFLAVRGIGPCSPISPDRSSAR
ncbi:hypothetical protein [Nocardia sp. IFM 10818]